MYPAAVQLDYRSSVSFPLPPAHHVDPYICDSNTYRTSTRRLRSGHQQFTGQWPDSSQQLTRAKHSSPAVSGLRTPPTEEMGTTYQVPNLASYENNNVYRSAYASTMGHADRTRGAVGDAIYDTATRYSTSQEQDHQPQYQQLIQQSRARVFPSTTSQSSTSRPSTRTPTPSSGTSAKTQSEALTAVRDAAMVLHNLQIPTCISPNGGDLADFTAQVGSLFRHAPLLDLSNSGLSQITCLFWFESIKTLEAAENIRNLPPNAAVRRLTENALPVPGFKKWVHTVLSTTQVTQNVIILALMFIYRLKVKNPAVKGRAGSEYRLLTVALMLGNKCRSWHSSSS
jgi:hypothetical protein